MVSRLGIGSIAGAICIVLSGASAGVAAAGAPGSPCKNHSVSAVNQYCENIPSPKGPKTPTVGTPAVGSPAGRALITPRAMRALKARSGVVPRSVRRRLLALPAAQKSHPIKTQVSVSEANVPSSSITLILILIAVALALVAVAFRRWRRRRTA